MIYIDSCIDIQNGYPDRCAVSHSKRDRYLCIDIRGTHGAIRTHRHRMYVWTTSATVNTQVGTLSVQGRLKCTFKLANGEYVASERLENEYKQVQIDAVEGADRCG